MRSIATIQREMDTAFRLGEVDLLEALSFELHVARQKPRRSVEEKARAEIHRAGAERRAGKARGFTVRKRGIVFGRR